MRTDFPCDFSPDDATLSQLIAAAGSLPLPLKSANGTAAIFEIRPAKSLYWSNGTRYASQSAMLTALSASVSGSTWAVGPYVDPAGREYLTNGTFASDTAGWTAGSATISSVAGELVFDPSASSAYVYQRIPTSSTGYPSRAFQFTGTGRRGTNTANTPMIAASSASGTFTGNFISGTAPTSSSMSTSTIYISTAGGTVWLGIHGVSGLGTTIWDNFSAREVMPIAGWSPFAGGVSTAATPAFSIVIEGTMPSALPAAGQVQIIWQADANTERDRISLRWDETGHLFLVITSNNGATANLDLGAVAVSTAFKLAIAFSKGTNAVGTGVAASLNGANSVLQQTVATLIPGCSHMRLGRNVAGTSQFLGTVNRLAVLAGYQPADWLENAVAPENALGGEGDSYWAGAFGYVLGDKMEVTLGRTIINCAVGGSTVDMIYSRLQAKIPYLRGRRFVIWDGSANGIVSAEDQLAKYKAIYDTRPSTTSSTATFYSSPQ